MLHRCGFASRPSGRSSTRRCSGSRRLANYLRHSGRARPSRRSPPAQPAVWVPTPSIGFDPEGTSSILAPCRRRLFQTAIATPRDRRAPSASCSLSHPTTGGERVLAPPETSTATRSGSSNRTRTPAKRGVLQFEVPASSARPPRALAPRSAAVAFPSCGCLTRCSLAPGLCPPV